MGRMFVDCREYPSETNCSIAISADTKRELIEAAAQQLRPQANQDTTARYRVSAKQRALIYGDDLVYAVVEPDDDRLSPTVLVEIADRVAQVTCRPHAAEDAIESTDGYAARERVHQHAALRFKIGVRQHQVVGRLEIGDHPLLWQEAI